MRVIGGTLKGRHLSAVRGGAVRPTTDKVREAIFAILAPCLAGGSVLDLFAGTGALGIEAVSRGMGRAVFVDNSPQALVVLEKNVAVCELESRTEIIRLPVERGLRLLCSRNERFDLVFLDPPYQELLAGKTLVHISESGLLTPEGVIVAEHGPREPIASRCGTLLLDDQRRYGQTIVSFFFPQQSI